MENTEFDVVVVSDFSSAVSRRFEIMTLYFLASWLEYAESSRHLPLHIACIGVPPSNVMELANQCDARISVHAPCEFGGFANKLRGFEIDRQTDHVLLLDSDMLVLSDIMPLKNLLGENCISAAAANGPCVVPPTKWKQIHELLGIDYPDENLLPLNLKLDTFQCHPYRNQTIFPPFYNGGIVFAPWQSSLGTIWKDHLLQISKVAKRKAKISNQPSLATAIAYLKSSGYSFKLLPDEYHVRWQHIAAGVVTCNNIRLLHTIGFGRWNSEQNNNSARDEIEIYLQNTLRMTRDVYSHNGTQPIEDDDQRIKECHRVYEKMKYLYENYVSHFRQ